MTAGGCRLQREVNALVVTPLPREHGPALAARIRWDALPWQLAEPKTVTALAEDGTVMDRHPVRRDGEFILLECQPGMFCYRVGLE